MALTVAVLLTAGNSGYAANPVQPTILTIPETECANNTKEVAARLVEVRCLANAEPEVEKRIVKVIPKSTAILSPMALSEAEQ